MKYREKIYKYWLFYVDNELYAYTDNKKYAKEFEKSRNMRLFKKQVRDISRNTLNDLANYEPNKFMIKTEEKVYDKSKLEWIKTSFILTKEEKLCISNMTEQIMIDELYKYCWINPQIFQKKIFKALDILGFITNYSSLTGEYDLYSDSERLDIKPDFLGVLIYLYGKTLIH